MRRIELSAEELSLLLGPDRFGGGDEPHAGAPDAPATALIAAPTPVGGPAPEVPAAPIDTAPRTTHATPHADAIQPPTGAARHLGDADLVQAILEGAPNFEQLLLRAIRERTGEDLARIVTGAAGDAMVVAGTGTHVGEGRALVVPIAPDARAAWAAWYRRWSELASLAATHAPRGAWDDTTGFPSWARMRPQVAHRIVGAGTHAVGGRAAQESALAVSRELGVPLDAHAATPLHALQLTRDDVIVCMDAMNEANVAAAYPALAERVFRVGDILAAGVTVAAESHADREIRDPYGEGSDATRDAFDRVAVLSRVWVEWALLR